MAKKRKSYNFINCLILFAVLFGLCMCFPLTGNDWYTEGAGAAVKSVLGLFKTAAALWETYTGRVFAAILKDIAGSRRFIRELMRAGIMLCVICLANKSSEKKNSFSVFGAAAVLLYIPSAIFAQSYTQYSNFFSFVTPLAFTLACIYMLRDLFLGKNVEDNITKFFALLVFGFAGQFFTAVSTAHSLVSAIAFIIWYAIEKKKFSASLLAYFTGTAAGTIIPVLYRAGQGLEAYPEFYTGSGINGILSCITANYRTVINYFILKCPVIFISAAVLCVILFIRKKKRTAKDLFLLVLVLVCSIYFAADYFNLYAFPAFAAPSATIIWVVSLAFYICSVMKKSEAKSRALYSLLSAVFCVLPLLSFESINNGCFYISYVFLAVMLINMASVIKITLPGLLPFAAFAAAAIFLVYTYLPLRAVEMEQTAILENAIRQKETYASIPSFEKSTWLYDENSDKIKYYYYYITPGDLEITYRK